MIATPAIPQVVSPLLLQGKKSKKNAEDETKAPASEPSNEVVKPASSPNIDSLETLNTTFGSVELPPPVDTQEKAKANKSDGGKQAAAMATTFAPLLGGLLIPQKKADENSRVEIPPPLISAGALKDSVADVVNYERQVGEIYSDFILNRETLERGNQAWTYKTKDVVGQEVDFVIAKVGLEPDNKGLFPRSETILAKRSADGTYSAATKEDYWALKDELYKLESSMGGRPHPFMEQLSYEKNGVDYYYEDSYQKVETAMASQAAAVKDLLATDPDIVQQQYILNGKNLQKSDTKFRYQSSKGTYVLAKVATENPKGKLFGIMKHQWVVLKQTGNPKDPKYKLVSSAEHQALMTEVKEKAKNGDSQAGGFYAQVLNYERNGYIAGAYNEVAQTATMKYSESYQMAIAEAGIQTLVNPIATSETSGSTGGSAVNQYGE